MTYPTGAVSLLWPPSLRPLGGFCQSSLTSPPQPYPRRSPYNPWLRNAGAQRKNEASVRMVTTRQPAPRTTRWNNRFWSCGGKSVSALSCASRGSTMKRMRPNHLFSDLFDVFFFFLFNLRLLPLVHFSVLHPSTGSDACARSSLRLVGLVICCCCFGCSPCPLPKITLLG